MTVDERIVAGLESLSDYDKKTRNSRYWGVNPGEVTIAEIAEMDEREFLDFLSALRVSRFLEIHGRDVQ